MAKMEAAKMEATRSDVAKKGAVETKPKAATKAAARGPAVAKSSTAKSGTKERAPVVKAVAKSAAKSVSKASAESVLKAPAKAGAPADRPAKNPPVAEKPSKAEAPRSTGPRIGAKTEVASAAPANIEVVAAPAASTQARAALKIAATAPSPFPAASAAPATFAAPGKTSSTTTAGEDKELAKKTEPQVATATPVASEKTVMESRPVAKPAPAPAAKAKPAGQKHGFKLNEYIVYPAHGVGQIVGVEIQEVAGFSLELFVVSFIKDKMILKVPTSKVANVGMRKLAETNVVDKALGTLSGRARIKRTMWSRRAQEYEAKINSGDLVTISEVVRDLYRSDTQPEQSYSERQLYEAALDRMAREIAAVRKLIDSEALKLIESFLQKGPRRGQKSESDVGEDADEEDVDRAA
jgi:CarD family transcriptional regulator